MIDFKNPMYAKYIVENAMTTVYQTGEIVMVIGTNPVTLGRGSGKDVDINNLKDVWQVINEKGLIQYIHKDFLKRKRSD